MGKHVNEIVPMPPVDGAPAGIRRLYRLKTPSGHTEFYTEGELRVLAEQLQAALKEYDE